MLKGLMLLIAKKVARENRYACHRRRLFCVLLLLWHHVTVKLPALIKQYSSIVSVPVRDNMIIMMIIFVGEKKKTTLRPPDSLDSRETRLQFLNRIDEIDKDIK